MGIFKKKNKIDSEGLLKSAYKLGYEVGFHDHDEFLGWVRESKKTLFDEAKSAGSYETVANEFKKGKKEGHLIKQKKAKSTLTLDRSLKGEMKEPVEETQQGEKSFSKKDLSFLGQMKYSLVEKPLHISRATFIELPKLVRIPKFLRGYKSKK